MMWLFAAVAMHRQSSADLRERFQNTLNNAITSGRNTVGEHLFGPRTRAAVKLVADEHPYATADLIADAYDAFNQEHGVAEPPIPPKPPLKTVRAYLRTRPGDQTR